MLSNLEACFWRILRLISNIKVESLFNRDYAVGFLFRSKIPGLALQGNPEIPPSSGLACSVRELPELPGIKNTVWVIPPARSKLARRAQCNAGNAWIYSAFESHGRNRLHNPGLRTKKRPCICRAFQYSQSKLSEPR